MWPHRIFALDQPLGCPDKLNNNDRNRMLMHIVRDDLAAYRELCAPLSYHGYCGCTSSLLNTPPNGLDSISHPILCWNMNSCIFLFLFWNDTPTIAHCKWINICKLVDSNRKMHISLMSTGTTKKKEDTKCVNIYLKFTWSIQWHHCYEWTAK